MGKKQQSKASTKRRTKVRAENVFEFLVLTGVRLIHVDATLSIVDGKAPTDAQVKMIPSAGASHKGDRLNANVSLELIGKPEGEDGDDCSTVKINAHYQCVYRVEGAEMEDVTPHALTVANTAVLVVWPYLRELCNSTTYRMGLPPITLPMYTPPQASRQGMKFLKSIAPAKKKVATRKAAAKKAPKR